MREPQHPIHGQGVVITGAANGIGAALARALHTLGARLVLADLDAPALAALADELGALAVPGDVAGEAGVQHLVDTATAHLGRIDVYFANAGVASRGTSEDPEVDWDRSWQVNVMAHVRAARALVPGWLGTGGGRFVITASAAGLLTMIGSAPYSTTKHAAIAHAEWLSVTYGDRGVLVQAVCPQGVRTNMLTGSGSTGQAVLSPGALEPEDVAETIVDALRGKSFYILPHPEVAEYYQARATQPERWLAAMRRKQAKVLAAAQVAEQQ